MSLSVVGFIGLSILSQLAGVFLLMRTEGFTKPLPTLFCSLFFLLGIGVMAHLARKGVELGLLMPIMAASIPLIGIFIGIIFYGESASILKLSLLTSACVLIGCAAAFGN